MLVAVFAVLVPMVGRYTWGLLFPSDYLLFQEISSIEGKGFSAAGIVITNAGSRRQNSIVLSLPVSFGPEGERWFNVSPARRLILPFDNAEVSDALVAKGNRYEISVGTLMPKESVRVTLLAMGNTKDEQPTWHFYGLRVQSATTVALEASSTKHPTHDLSAADFYREMAPYVLAAAALFIALAVFVSLLFDLFFDSDEKKVARLWRQMDAIQERIFKERWRR